MTRLLKCLPAVLLAGAVMLTSGLSIAADKSAAKAEEPKAAKPADANGPRVQIAILLDTSSSMNGLINQARQQLWTIVNELATATQDGKEPRVEVALLQYGNSRLAKKDGYIQVIVEFTDNLDIVSEKLFALKTSGGSEHCGQVIDKAVTSLKWTKSDRDLKLIYIAGNEPFTQGPVDYRKACKSAIEKSITVNTIHCGSESAGINGKWKDGAVLADGSFVSINQNRKVVAINAPQDKKIIELSTQLNTTYIAYGDAKRRQYFIGNQKAQDSNAAKSGNYANVNRAFTKGGRLYQNWQWDLVDAVNQNKVDLSKIKKEHLPKCLKDLSLVEQKKYIKTKSGERTKLQAKMKELKKARDKYVAAERRKLAKRGKGDALETAVIGTLHKQAAKKKFKFKK